MSHELENRKEIRKHTEALLSKADAAGRWPTPVDDIVAASKLDLSEDDDSPFSLAALRRAPKHLKKAIAAVKSGRVHAILDRRERVVHLDPSLEHSARRKFLKLHEVTHDILPWQADLAFADSALVLSEATNRRFEREANQGAADLYFQGERFTKLVGQYKTGLPAVEEVKQIVGASLRATVRRYAEVHNGDVCAFYLEKSPCAVDPTAYKRFEVSQSASWTERFGSSWSWPRTLDTESFPFIVAIDNPDVGLGGDLTWPDLDSEPVPIRAQAAITKYGVALLLWVPRRELGKRKRRLEVSVA